MCAVETKAQQQSGRTQNQSNKVPVWPTLLTACLQERGYSEELGFDPHASSSKILNRSRSPWPTTLTGDLSANSVCRSLFCFSSLRVVLKIQLISVIDKSNQDEDLARNSPVNVSERFLSREIQFAMFLCKHGCNRCSERSGRGIFERLFHSFANERKQS